MLRLKSELAYLVRYSGGGILNTLIGVSIIMILTVGAGASPFTANIGGYLVSLSLGFLISKRYVFFSDGHFAREGTRYVLSFAVCFVFNLAVLWSSINVFHLNAVPAQLIAAGAYTSTMYLLSRYFIFTVSTSSRPSGEKNRQATESHLISPIMIPKRDWSAKQFAAFFGIYFGSLLLIALPEGDSTLLAPYSIPNVECAQNQVASNFVKKCEPNLQLFARSTAEDYLRFFGGGDAASYVKGGMLLAGRLFNGSPDAAGNIAGLSIADRLTLLNQIGYGLWPPGMFFLNALPISLDSDFQLGLYHVIAASALWSLAFALIAGLLAQRTKVWIAVVPPFFVMAFPLFHDYLIRYGVMFSETYGAALMVIAFTLLIVNFYREANKSLMLTTGVVLALSSFVRSQMLPVSIGVTIAVSLAYFIGYMRLSTGDPRNSGNRVGLGSVVLLLIAFYLPIGGYMVFNRGALFHADYVWEYPFKIPAYPNAGAANFTALGGVRAACEVDPVRCEELHSKIKNKEISHSEAKLEVMKAFIFHPIDFSAYKLPVAWKYWLESSNNLYWQNSFIFFLLIACVVYMIVQRMWLLLSLSISTFLLLIAPPFLLHFESRYFYLIKTYILFLPIWLILSLNIKKLMSLRSVIDGQARRNSNP